MVTVVARVKDPYGQLGNSDVPPLAVGLFVDAMIEGIELSDAIVLPRNALQGGDRVFVLDADDRVHFQPIEITRAERDQVIVKAGVKPGDRLSVTPMPWAVEGMQVAPFPDDSMPNEMIR